MDYGVIAQELRAHGTDVTADDLRRAEVRARVRLDACFAPGVSTESGQIGRRYLQYVLEGVGVTDAATLAAMAEWRGGYNPPAGLWTIAEPDAEPALCLLQQHGVRAAVISNSNGSARGILEGLGLARYLDFVLDSSEVGVEKPDSRIFQLALDRAGVTAHEAVYVGDLYSVDVLGARAAGLRAILLDPAGCWGERDCDRVPSVLAACELIVRNPSKSPRPQR